jgi:hypothetical protein
MEAAATLATGMGKAPWPQKRAATAVAGGLNGLAASLASAEAAAADVGGAATTTLTIPSLNVDPQPPAGPPAAPQPPPGGSLPGSLLLGSVAGSLGNLLGSLGSFPGGSALSFGELLGLGRSDSFELTVKSLGVVGGGAAAARGAAGVAGERRPVA